MIISKGRGYVYGIEYHIVFCTKYRKKILTDSVKDSLFQLIILLSQEMDFKIIEIYSLIFFSSVSLTVATK